MIRAAKKNHFPCMSFVGLLKREVTGVSFLLFVSFNPLFHLEYL